MRVDGCERAYYAQSVPAQALDEGEIIFAVPHPSRDFEGVALSLLWHGHSLNAQKE